MTLCAYLTYLAYHYGYLTCPPPVQYPLPNLACFDLLCPPSPTTHNRTTQPFSLKLSLVSCPPTQSSPCTYIVGRPSKTGEAGQVIISALTCQGVFLYLDDTIQNQRLSHRPSFLVWAALSPLFPIFLGSCRTTPKLL